MHHRRLLLVLSLVLALTGCALPWQRAKAPQPLPDAQQIFRPFMAGPKNGDLDSLDPALIQFGTDYTLAQLIFPPLVTLDDHNQVAPWAAERWEPSADGLTWTFHIHPDMKWSDGVPIDASTYAYSINRSLDPCIASGVAYYLSGTGPELITGSVAFNYDSAHPCLSGATVSPETLVGKSILAPDPQTLVLHLSHPAAYFPMALTYATAWAQPRQLIDKYQDTWIDHLADGGGFGGNLFKVTRWDHAGHVDPVGKVMRWDHAGHVDLVRNEAFWGQKPRLHEIDVTLNEDLDTMWADYKAGKGDYFSTPLPAELSIARAMPGYHADPDPAILYITPNWTTPPFDDVRVRQAFDLALDRRANGTLPTYAAITPTIHMVPQGMLGYNPNLEDPMGRVGKVALSPDVARAGALWQAYVNEKFGGDAAKAPPVTFLYRAGTAAAEANARQYLAQWQAAMPGAQITIAGWDRGACQCHKPPTLQLITASWIMDYPDPQDFLSLLVHTGSPYNQSGISLPAADALMDQADANLDPAQRLQQYQQAEQLLVNEVAWIPLSQGLNQYLVRPRVAGGYHERAAGSAALAVWQRIYMTSSSH